MFKKKIKIEVPKDKICYCGRRCKDIDISVTHDGILRVIYECECGKDYCDLKKIKFI